MQQSHERSSKAQRTRIKHLCGHCNQLLPKSTFYRHKDTFYNPVSRQWNTGTVKLSNDVDLSLATTPAIDCSSSDSNDDIPLDESMDTQELAESACEFSISESTTKPICMACLAIFLQPI